MQVNLYAQTGEKTKKTVELPGKVFGAPVNEKLLSQYVFIYLSNQREAIAHTKERGEVSGGGRKPWKQKGTGRARSGSIRSPLWRGGGVTFGPRSERNWKKGLNKKMRAGAMRSALSKVLSAGALKVVGKISLKDTKLTKQAAEIASKFKARKMTIVAPAKDEKLLQAFANLPDVRVIQVGELNAYDLLTGGQILFLEEAVGFTNIWAE